jgi:hypothetical protein
MNSASHIATFKPPYSLRLTRLTAYLSALLAEQRVTADGLVQAVEELC